MSPEAKKPKPPNGIEPSHLKVYAEVYAEVLEKARVSPSDVERLTKDALTTPDGETQQKFAQAVNKVSGGIIRQEKL